MRLFPVSTPRCRCRADVTAETAVITQMRGRPPVPKRAKMVFHARRDGARFWHWSDQEVKLI